MRIERINELIKRELSSMILLGDINDPRIHLVTIVSVDVSKDLHHARVRFSLLNDDAKAVKNAIAGFHSGSGYIRKTIAAKLALRYTPEFQFIYDKGIQHVAKVEATLAEIKRTLHKDNS